MPARTNALGAMTLLTFVGLITTAIGSSWYHMQVPPNDAGLAINRFGMVSAFAGILGLATAHKLSEWAGLALAVITLVVTSSPARTVT